MLSEFAIILGGVAAGYCVGCIATRWSLASDFDRAKKEKRWNTALREALDLREKFISAREKSLSHD